jgi:hypothetical protein
MRVSGGRCGEAPLLHVVTPGGAPKLPLSTGTGAWRPCVVDEADVGTLPWAAPASTSLGPGIEPATWGRHLHHRVQDRGTAFREQGDIMLKARRDAAMKVAESLFAAEEAIDLALARVAELNGTMATARTEAKLSAIVAQGAFDTAASVFASLARARCDIVETHKRLTEAKDQIGLRTVAIGDLGKPESIPPMVKGDARHLQVVA